MKKREFEPAYRLNLQFFADGEGGTDEGGTDEGGTDTVETAKALTAEDIQKMIQSEVDKVRTKSAKEIKAAEDKVKALQNEKLTDQEKFELAQQELAEKTKTLQERENIIFAKDALKEAGFSNFEGDFLEFVTAENEEITSGRVQKLKKAIEKAVEAEKEAFIKSTGRNYQKGSGGSGGELSEAARMAQEANASKSVPNGPNPWA